MLTDSFKITNLRTVVSTMSGQELSLLVKKYGLLTKRVVKMAGYWPSSFFGVFMDRDEVEVHKHAKKERGQYPAILTGQAWSILKG